MNQWLLILFALIFSAFFSGMEIAFLTSNKLRIELDRKQGAFGAEMIRFFTKNPGQYIATMLIGNNICLVVYGLAIARLLNPIIMPLVDSDVLTLIIQTILSTALILLAGEFLPKTIFALNPNFFLKSLSYPTIFFFILFYPISKLALWVSNIFIRVFFRQSSAGHTDEEKVFTRVDLNHFVTQTDQDKDGGEPHSNFRIFRNALDFSDMRVRECMVPRTEIEAVEVKSGIDRLRAKFTETRFSRILVYQDSIDHITGYFELKDLFKNPPDIESGMRKIAIVPETMPASKLLKVFVEEKKNIAVVVDEFGGTSGMVTIEDVVEEIVGDIEDEHDTNELVEKVTGENQYILSGRLEIDYLNDKYGINLPEEDDFETLAGMVMYYHGSIPRQNDSIRIGNISIKVIKVSATRIDLLSLKVEQG